MSALSLVADVYDCCSNVNVRIDTLNQMMNGAGQFGQRLVHTGKLIFSSTYVEMASQLCNWFREKVSRSSLKKTHYILKSKNDMDSSGMG